MSKKDYALIAEALNDALVLESYNGEDAMTAVRTAVVRIADALQGDNPRFNRTRFLRAVEQGAV